VVVLDDLVAVVGDHFWAARQGLIALNPSWHDGANQARSSDQIMAELQTIAARKGAVAKRPSLTAASLSVRAMSGRDEETTPTEPRNATDRKAKLSPMCPV